MSEKEPTRKDKPSATRGERPPMRPEEFQEFVNSQTLEDTVVLTNAITDRLLVDGRLRLLICRLQNAVMGRTVTDDLTAIVAEDVVRR